LGYFGAKNIGVRRRYSTANEEIVKKAAAREPGYDTIRKLLTNLSFDK
jgi:hypothetical protein